MVAALFTRSLIGVSVAVTLAGCVLAPPPSNSELQKQALTNNAVPGAWKAGGAEAPVAERWLASFNDPALSALVDEALQYNADLQASAARAE